MRFLAPRRALVSAVVLLCVLHSAVGVGVVGAGTGPSASAPAQDLAQQTETPTNNTSVQQENPEEVNEQGDTDALRSYLAQKLAERLVGSSRQISQGQYKKGQSILGDEYNDQLEKYVDVQGETDGDGAGDAFEEASETQKEFGSNVREYNETYQEYQAAKAAGNSSRTRELARELDRIANQVNSSGRDLTRSYTRIENTTGSDLSVARANVENTSRAIQERQEEIVAATFVRTRLSVRAESASASFDEPLAIDGQLGLENGTALRNETVEIRIGGATETVQTDREGRFALDFRPVSMRTGDETVAVTYLPPDASVYLGSNTTLAINITQVTANVTVSTSPRTARFGDELTVSGQATVNGTPVPGARVQISIGGRVLGSAVTGSNGTYRLTGTLPASVPNGTATVHSAIVPSDRAVQSDAATTNLQVEETRTLLSVNATQIGTSAVQLSGELRTADGRPLSGQTIELRVDGSTVATVETRADGTYQRTVSVREGLVDDVTVRAVFDEPRSNLADATAQTRVELISAEEFRSETESGPDSARQDTFPFSLEQLAGGGVVVLALLVLAWIVRRDEERVDQDQPPVASTSSTPTASESEPSIVEQASSLLSAGDSDAAIRTLYAAVRESIGRGDSSLTHWEFYTAASDRLDPEATGTLEQLTEAYERVVYSPEGVDADVIERLLDESTRLTGERSEERHDAD